MNGTVAARCSMSASSSCSNWIRLAHTLLGSLSRWNWPTSSSLFQRQSRWGRFWCTTGSQEVRKSSPCGFPMTPTAPPCQGRVPMGTSNIEVERHTHVALRASLYFCGTQCVVQKKLSRPFISFINYLFKWLLHTFSWSSKVAKSVLPTHNLDVNNQNQSNKQAKTSDFCCAIHKFCLHVDQVARRVVHTTNMSWG